MMATEYGDARVHRNRREIPLFSPVDDDDDAASATISVAYRELEFETREKERVPAPIIVVDVESLLAPDDDAEEGEDDAEEEEKSLPPFDEEEEGETTTGPRLRAKMTLPNRSLKITSTVFTVPDTTSTTTGETEDNEVVVVVVVVVETATIKDVRLGSGVEATTVREKKPALKNADEVTRSALVPIKLPLWRIAKVYDPACGRTEVIEYSPNSG